MEEPVTILDLKVHPVSMQEALARCEIFFAYPGLKQVITANPETAMAAGGDLELQEALAAADLVVADGVGLVWAARRLGRPLPERVPGVELSWELLARCAQRERPVYLLGGAPGVAKEAARRLVTVYPELAVAGAENGYFSQEEEEAVVQRVTGSGAELLLVGLGMPRQEIWIHRHRERLGVKVALGVGGSLDVFAGRVKRAPRAWRRLHLEWLYRILSQPSRWRRFLVLPRFCLRVLHRG